MKIGNSNYSWSFRKFSVNMVKLFLLTLTGILCFSLAAGARQDQQIQLLTVAPGDTLWSIADQLNPSSDPRTTIAQIKALNNLQSSELAVGQTLLVEFK